MRFLFDECLSPELASVAHEAGYEASHVVHLGMAGAKDRQLIHTILDGDWTFVTRNSIDFRGPRSKPGSKGEYAVVDLHAGLICLNGEPLVLDEQIELFAAALSKSDMRNRSTGYSR